jgi:hypothetical protein
MDSTPSPTAQRERAAERLAERRRHVRRIRARVAGLSLATFLAASGAVLVQLVTGHDPALARTDVASAPATTLRAQTQTGSRSAARTRSSARTTAKDATASGHRSTRSGHSSRSSSSSAAVSPSAVTTSAS